MAGIHETLLIEIMKVGRLYEKKMTPIFKQYGLTLIQYNILRILNGAFPSSLNPGEIKSRILYENSDLTRLIDRLVDKNMVSRGVSEENRRKINIQITDKGRTILDQIMAKMVKVSGDFYAGTLPEDQVIQITQKLELLESQLTKSDQY